MRTLTLLAASVLAALCAGAPPTASAAQACDFPDSPIGGEVGENVQAARDGAAGVCVEARETVLDTCEFLTGLCRP